MAVGHDFLIRVGANVTLLKELGYFRECAGRVYLWPDKPARRGQPPLALRLVVAHGGKHPVYLVTSVLATTALSNGIASSATLAGGGSAFFRFAVAAGKTGTVAWGTLPAGVVMTLVRVE